MTKKRTRAAIYVRLSRNRTDERSASTTRQESECRKLARARGWEVETVFVDDDVSAYSGKRRPGYEQLIAVIEAGAVDALIAWAPDRLHRSPRDLEDFVDLIEKSGVEVATVQAGQIDLETPAGRMQARMLGNVARYESEHRSARTRLAHDQIAAEGRWSGGRRPYGYHPQPGGTMEVDSAEAAIIREAVERITSGERVGSVANDLRRREVPTVTGADWRGPTLRRIVTSPTIAGRRVSKGVDVGPGKWPAIVTNDELETVTAVLSGGTHRGRVPRVALLSGGRLQCATCSAPMSTARRTNGRRTYRCMSCFMQIAAEPLDDAIGEAVCGVLDTTTLPTRRVKGSGAELARLEEQLAELAADHGAGIIGRREWLAARQPLLARIDSAWAATQSAATVAALDGITGKNRATGAWPELSLERRQAIVDALIGTVSISPSARRGPGLDLDRISIDWKA